jgi:hypothetical protein
MITSGGWNLNIKMKWRRLSEFTAVDTSDGMDF